MNDGLKLQFLIRQKMTQGEFARKAGYDGGYVSRVIKQGHVPLPMREKVQEVLGYAVEKWEDDSEVSVDDLMATKVERKPSDGQLSKKEEKELKLLFEKKMLEARVKVLEAIIEEKLLAAGMPADTFWPKDKDDEK